jgi:hypothetical protein
MLQTPDWYASAARPAAWPGSIAVAAWAAAAMLAP